MFEPKKPLDAHALTKHPFRGLVAMIVSMLLVIGALGVSIIFSYQRLATFETYIVPVRQLKADLHFYEVARSKAITMFAITRDKQWRQQYYETLSLIQNRLKQLAELKGNKSRHIEEAIAAADASSAALIEIEEMAMQLVWDGRSQSALELLQSEKYLVDKQNYVSALNKIRKATDQNIQEIHSREKQVMAISLIVAGGLVFFFLPIAWYMRIRMLKNWQKLIHKNTSQILQGEKELQEANIALTSSLEAVRQQRAEITLLSEMANMLHSCVSTEEAFRVLESYCKRLFPGSRGALYRASRSKEEMEEVARWDNPACHKTTFNPFECWALRRGSLHAGDPQSAAICDHVVMPGKAVPHYVCIPLVAQNTNIGLFYLEVGCLPDNIPDKSMNSISTLASAVAEQAALAIANLDLRDSLREQSIRDQLTGLFNRRYLEETLERELIRSERQSKSFCVIGFDVDHFKRYNDTFGHEAGDKILRSIGQLLASTFRGSDVPCRMGGEEFVVLLPDAPLAGALARAEEVRAAVATLELKHAEGSLGEITISAGVAEFPTHGKSSEELLRAADAALYRAKHEGRNRVVAASRTSAILQN